MTRFAANRNSLAEWWPSFPETFFAHLSLLGSQPKPQFLGSSFSTTAPATSVVPNFKRSWFSTSAKSVLLLLLLLLLRTTNYNTNNAATTAAKTTTATGIAPATAWDCQCHCCSPAPPLAAACCYCYWHHTATATTVSAQPLALPKTKVKAGIIKVKAGIINLKHHKSLFLNKPTHININHNSVNSYNASNNSYFNYI